MPIKEIHAEESRFPIRLIGCHTLVQRTLMLVGLFTCAAVVQLMSKIKVIVPFCK